MFLDRISKRSYFREEYFIDIDIAIDICRNVVRKCTKIKEKRKKKLFLNPIFIEKKLKNHELDRVSLP